MTKDFLLSKNFVKFNCLFWGALIIFGGANLTVAQTQPQFIPFWRANTYAPADFSGKVFPTEKSTIEASFELLRGGKLVDLGSNKVIWLVNGNEVGNGQNPKTVTFKNYSFGRNEIVVDVRILDFKGQTLSYSFTIPVATPKLVIESPYDKNNLTEKNLTLAALPYFFNVSSLNELVFSWAIDGVHPEGDVSEPYRLVVTIPDGTPPGTRIAVGASAENPASSLERTNNEIIYQVAQ